MARQWKVTSDESLQRYGREGWRVLLTDPDGHRFDLFLTAELLRAQEVFEADDGDSVVMHVFRCLAEDAFAFSRRYGTSSAGLGPELAKRRLDDEAITELLWSPDGINRADHERRTYPRQQYEVAVAISGFRPGSGVTVDLSRGGVKVSVAGWVPEDAEGHECAVRFMGVGDEVRPHYAGGVVRRVEAAGSACYVGIAFDAPLRVLDVEAMASR